MVAYIIIVKCLKYHLSQQELKLKTLYLEMTCSEIATREQIVKLTNGGWLILEQSHQDKRVKFLKPTDKLLRTSNQIMHDSLSHTIKSIFKLGR